MPAPTDHLTSLNPAQRAAAEHGTEALLIIAGAGTGKTNTLAHRVAHLMVRGADPARILLLTFTRRAAEIMTRRAERIARGARVTWAGTFHAVANRLLRHHAAAVGLDPAFTVLDRSDSADLLNVVRNDLGLSQQAARSPKKETCLAIYSHAVNAYVVTLEQNYRSTQPILDASNAVISLATAAFPKRLFSERPSAQRPFLVWVKDEQAQADYIAERILEHREAGIDLHRQAVLMRAAHHSDLLEVELGKRNIPFVKFGGLKFLEAAHVKDMLCVLRWAENPRDDVAGFRVLQLLPGLGPAHARRILDSFETFQNLGGVAVPAAARSHLPRLSALLSALCHATEWPGQVGMVREWYQPQLERLYESALVRSGDLEQLETLAANHPSRESFLSDLTLDPPDASGDHAGDPLLDEDYLILSTIHSAKGQEWDVVYVLNVVDGCIPSDMATGSAAEIEEERRLLYVALTRARDRLYLLQPQRFYTGNRRAGDRHVYAPRTRFIPDGVLALFERRAARGEDAADLTDTRPGAPIDVATRLREMWS